MAEIIKMPKLSDTMEEGVVAKWHKNVGDKVEDGELLADIETDKATMEFESFQSGTILHLGVEEGSAAQVDAVLAIVGDEGEDFTSLLSDAGSPSNGSGQASNKEDNSSNGGTKKSASANVDVSTVNAKIIKMPKLSDTMTEGTVASWAKQVGDKVESGEILAEIETDKATMEFESFEDGTLLYQAVKESESAEVDAILAIIGEQGADYQKLIDAFRADDQSSSNENSEKEENAVVQDSMKVETTVPSNNSGRIVASPLAKRLAKEKGIDLSLLNGSGDGGRIVKRDIEEHQPATVQTSVKITPAFGQESHEEVSVSQMRKAIARRLGESKYSAPHFYLTIDIDMDNAIASRKAINELPDTKISFNDLVIKSAAAALKRHPAVNSSWLEDKIRMHHHVNIGVAVAVEDGLVVPVVKNADIKQLSSISSEVKEYADKARNKRLQPNEMEGSTFSVSNLGMFGIEEFTAIINPPNACILAVGAIRQEAVVLDGQIKVGNRMKVTLSCDHRVVDGATGAQFLQTFKTYLQNPVTILG